MSKHNSALPEPWRSLYSSLIVLGASILQQRHFGSPINLFDAGKQDDALAKLGMDARLIADAMALAAQPAASLREQEDAARYQHLRKGGSPFVRGDWSGYLGDYKRLSGDELDAAIDAQRLGRGKKDGAE